MLEGRRASPGIAASVVRSRLWADTWDAEQLRCVGLRNETLLAEYKLANLADAMVGPVPTGNAFSENQKRGRIALPRVGANGYNHLNVSGVARQQRCTGGVARLHARLSEAHTVDPSAQANDVEAEWERTMAALHDLITKRHRERLQTDSIDAMHDYLARLQLDVSRLKVVHVAGTKGKGSTCTMVESILRTKGYRTALYTSPHLVDVRERIRINGALLPKEAFSRFFWEVHEQLRHTADAPSTRFPAMPGYFRFLTLLAFKVFLSLGVDVAVIEVGLGGRLDATNVVSPLVCGITSLDYDHTNVLGNTLAEIAFEKAASLKSSLHSAFVQRIALGR